jgi:CheY-like chemotaxis protein
MKNSRGPVLVVDDNEDLADTVCMVLADEGYEALLASSVQEALAILDGATKPCLVLVDLNMPDVPGLVVLDRMRSDPALKEIPVLIMSGAGPAAIEEALALHPGAEPLAKPFDLLALLRRLARDGDS